MAGDVEKVLGGEGQAGERPTGRAGDAERRAGDERARHPPKSRARPARRLERSLGGNTGGSVASVVTIAPSP
jgi:hypothetical protein